MSPKGLVGLHLSEWLSTSLLVLCLHYEISLEGRSYWSALVSGFLRHILVLHWRLFLLVGLVPAVAWIALLGNTPLQRSYAVLSLVYELGEVQRLAGRVLDEVGGSITPELLRHGDLLIDFPVLPTHRGGATGL